jgi:hypothetical protein
LQIGQPEPPDTLLHLPHYRYLDPVCACPLYYALYFDLVLFTGYGATKCVHLPRLDP